MKATLIITALLIALAAVSRCNHWSQEQLRDNGAATGSAITDLQSWAVQHEQARARETRSAQQTAQERKEQAERERRATEAARTAVWDEIERQRKLESAAKR